MSEKIDWGLFSEVQAAGEGLPALEKGIYPCKVISVEDAEDKQYLKIKFDIVKGDQKDRFSTMEKMYKEWPNQGTLYRSYKPNAYPFLKNWVTSLEKSNSGYNFRATNGDFKSFENKYFIAVFGEEETPFPDDNGAPIVSVRLQTVRSVEAYKNNEIKVPTEVKKLSGAQLDLFNEKLSESVAGADDYTSKVIQERKAAKQAEEEKLENIKKELRKEEDWPF